MELSLYEESKPLVLRALQNGDFDYVEAASEVFETDFFKYISAKNILGALAATYPTPRFKEEVPLWLYIASELSMRLHGVHSFHAYPMMVRAGGMLNAFGPQQRRSVQHPDTKDTTIACEGFNRKNHYDRETPCDQDTLRKLAKDTPAQAAIAWFNHELPKIWRAQRTFDKEGIFIGDGSYIFVPDNPAYEGSTRMLFDESNHPIDKEGFEKISDDRKLRCQWRRCYKMITLLHTNAKQEYFTFVALKIVSGKEHECPLLYEMVKDFVASAGHGVMKKLILDRGFIDGEEISRCKREYGVNVLIPVRKNMNVYTDAMALFQAPDVKWVECEPPPPPPEPKSPPRFKPMIVRIREKKRQKTLKAIKQEQPSPPPNTVIVKREAAAINDFTSWSSCTAPLTVIANRDIYADGHKEIWLLLSTQPMHNPATARQDYHLRQTTEERYRQLKCFADLARFTSRCFSLVVNQVIFTMLAYNLLQHYLLRKGRQEHNAKTPLTVRRQLLPVANHIIVYYMNYYGLFDTLEFIELLTTGLSEEARKKLGEKSRRLRRELLCTMRNPRPP